MFPLFNIYIIHFVISKLCESNQNSLSTHLSIIKHTITSLICKQTYTTKAIMTHTHTHTMAKTLEATQSILVIQNEFACKVSVLASIRSGNEKKECSISLGWRDDCLAKRVSYLIVLTYTVQKCYLETIQPFRSTSTLAMCGRAYRTPNLAKHGCDLVESIN